MDATKDDIVFVTTEDNHDTEAAEGKHCSDCPLVNFEAGDPDNPTNWHSRKKWSITIVVALLNLTYVLGTTMIVPAAPQVIASLHSSNALYRTLLVSIWELGEGIGPFFIAPLAERFGRSPALHIGNFLGILCSIAAALSVNLDMLIAFRFLTGCTSTALVLGPTIIGDLFEPHQRGGAMAAALSTQIIGTFIAPICGSFIAQAKGWRWTIWFNVITTGFFSLLCLIIVRETYAVKILERKEAAKGTSTQTHIGKTTVHKIIDKATGPIQMLVFSPVVFLISLYTALVYGMLYIILTTLTVVMETHYSFSSGTVGIPFLGFSIGLVIGMLFYGLTSDKYIQRQKATYGEAAFQIESRLVHMVLGAVILPCGFILYGWTLEYRVHYIVPLVAVGIVGFCFILTLLSTENYLVDAYPLRSASAVAASVIFKAICGAVFPLCGPPIYQRLGLGWGNSLLALIAAVFIPCLLMLWKYGDRLRRREKVAEA